MLLQKASQLNSVIKEINKIARGSHNENRRILTESSMRIPEVLTLKVSPSRKNQGSMSKSLQHLKFSYKKALLEEIKYR